MFLLITHICFITSKNAQQCYSRKWSSDVPTFLFSKNKRQSLLPGIKLQKTLFWRKTVEYRLFEFLRAQQLNNKTEKSPRRIHLNKKLQTEDLSEFSWCTRNQSKPLVFDIIFTFYFSYKFGSHSNRLLQTAIPSDEPRHAKYCVCKIHDFNLTSLKPGLHLRDKRPYILTQGISKITKKKTLDDQCAVRWNRHKSVFLFSFVI